jgi:tetratricopeptide (TPR) repeat protein
MSSSSPALPRSGATQSTLVVDQAIAALRSGDAAEAERLLRARLLQDPGDLACLIKLADIAAGQRRIAEAILLLTRVMQQAPHLHHIRFALAQLNEQAGDPDKAFSELAALPDAVRSQLEVQVCEATLLGLLGRHEHEIALFETVLRQHPTQSELWKSYGNALKTVGRTADAVRALRRATKLRPAFGEAWWSLANLKTIRFEGRDLAAMRKALGAKPPPEDALHLHFALGKGYEDRGEFERSFAHYAAGNDIVASQLTSEEQNAAPFVDAMTRAFTDSLVERLAGAGEPAADPIFIVGLQRSGSTLLEQILASHSLIEATSELRVIPQLFRQFVEDNGGQGRDLQVALGKLDRNRCAELGAEYLRRVKAYRLTDRPYFVDKLPANWMYAGFIHLILPNARIIDSRRNPMACGFSNFKQRYAVGVNFAYSQVSIGRFYRDYLRLMRHFEQVIPGAIHRVINERLIDDPEREIRRLLDFVGVRFEAPCLEFHRGGRAVRTPSAEQVRRPVNSEGVDQWRNYEPWLGPLKEALGDALDQWDDSPA